MNKAYCINLLKREDRWLQVLKEYPKFVDEIERIEGIDKAKRSTEKEDSWDQAR